MDFLKNGVLMAIIAHGLIGLSLVWDKVLLKKPETKNLVSYVFWMGALSVLALCLIPFGFRMPEPWIAGLAFGTGVLHLVAVFFYYAALKLGEASQTLAIMGGFSPVMTALLGLALLPNMLGAASWLAFALLTLGGFLMFFSERLPLRKILPRILIASLAFAFVNVLDKMVFNHTNFVSGYVFFTFGTFIGSLGLLTRPSWRKQIFETSERSTPRSRFWYFVNRVASGVGSFLTFYAISLTNPALVDAITGLRYAIIFLGALTLTYLKPEWLRENFRGRAIVGKALATALVVAGLVLVGLHSEGKGTGSPEGRLFPRLAIRPAAWIARQRTTTGVNGQRRSRLTLRYPQLSAMGAVFRRF